MNERKTKLIYCTKCLAHLKVIKTIYEKDSKDIIDIHFICSNCGHESGNFINENNIRSHRIDKLINT